MNSTLASDVSLVILSDNAPRTLSMTLATYMRSHLLDIIPHHSIVNRGSASAVQQIAAEYKIPVFSANAEQGFFSMLKEGIAQSHTKYLLFVEEDCQVWEHLKGANLEKELLMSLDLLESGHADLVRLRHAWQGKVRHKAASVYSYFYPVSQLSSRWAHAEGLSDAPPWVKAFRRLIHPYKSKRWIGRSVYVEENPHLKFPHYIKKVDNSYIIDSSVFYWTNQPTLISASMMKRIIKVAEARFTLFPSYNSLDFEDSVNGKDWKKAHLKVGVTEGIFT